MELNYTEFRHLVFYEKKLPCTYSVDVVDTERYYHIQAAEQLGGNIYFTKIDSINDTNDVIDFEQKYLSDCNQEILIPGMTHDIQAKMLHFLEGILTELKLLNKRIDIMVESGIGHDDIDDE